MTLPRVKLALAAFLTTLIPAPAHAVPIFGVSFSVDQTFCFGQADCGYVTAALFRSYSTGGPDDTRGVFECAAVVPLASRVVISCTYEDVTATDVSGLPVVAAAVGTIGGDGGPVEAPLCVDVSAELPDRVQTYSNCFGVFNFGS